MRLYLSPYSIILMNAQYQHPVRADIPLTIAYPDSGPSQGYAVLHANGCSHTNRGAFRRTLEFTGDANYGADDYFEVAPCARASKARKAS